MSQMIMENNTEEQDIVFHTESFTILKNHALEDMTLSLEARGLLATMFSLRSDWHYSIEGLYSILPHSKGKISRVIKELEEHGYVVRETTRNARGHFKHKYHIYDESQIYHDEYSGKRKKGKRFSPRPQNRDVDETLANTEVKPCPQNRDVEIGDIDNPVPEIDTQSSINKSNTNNQILKSINPGVASKRATTALPAEDCVDEIDMMDRKSEIREELSDRLNYDRLIAEYPKQKKLIDAIFRTMTEKLAHREMEPIKISGCTYSYEELEEAFNELEYEHIVYVITCISQSGRAIKNPQNYILRCLLQANTRDIYEASRMTHNSKNHFLQFEQHTYDFDELEEMLLEN